MQLTEDQRAAFDAWQDDFCKGGGFMPSYPAVYLAGIAQGRKQERAEIGAMVRKEQHRYQENAYMGAAALMHIADLLEQQEVTND